MESKSHAKHMALGSVSCGMACVAFALLASLTTPALAASHMRHVDVACGRGLTLLRVSATVQRTKSYTFGGACSLRTIYDTGPWGEGNPPLSASARWDPSSNTYTETLHLLAAQTFTVLTSRGESFTAGKTYRVGTAPEQATFKCDVDPVIDKSAHCTVVSQSNATGWGGQGDGFAWSAIHNKPLLAGVVTAAQAAAAARHTAAAYPPIQCRDLRLTDAAAAAKGSYKFNGTCQLYHTRDGSKGLQPTHVMINGHWNSTARQAREGVLVLTSAIEGGGSWSTTYTCNDDPWRNRHAQCSKTAQIGHAPPVYDPVTDLIDQHPVAMGMGGNTTRQSMHVPDAPKSRKSPMHVPDVPRSPMHVPDAQKPAADGDGTHSLNARPGPSSSKMRAVKTKSSSAKRAAPSSQQRLQLPAVQNPAGH